MLNRVHNFFKSLTDSCQPRDRFRLEENECSMPQPTVDPNRHKIGFVYLKDSAIRKCFKKILDPDSKEDDVIAGVEFFKYVADKDCYVFWDLCKQDGYDNLIRSYFRGTKQVLFFIDKMDDFLRLRPLINEVEGDMTPSELVSRFIVFDPLGNHAEQICDEAKKHGFAPIPMFSDKTKNEFLKAVTNYAENAEAYCTVWVKDEPEKYTPEQYQRIQAYLNELECTFPKEISALIASHVGHQLPAKFFPSAAAKDKSADIVTTAAATTAPALK